MLKSLYFLPMALLTFLLSCAGPKYTEDQLRDKVMTFHMHAQSRAYAEALKMMTKDERKAVSTKEGTMREEYQSAIRKLQASTLLKEHFSLDKYGNIVGMKSVLDQVRGVGFEDVMSGSMDPMTSSEPPADSSAQP